MPFKIMIEADNLGIAQAALAGVARALAEETGPAVFSDQAPTDIVQVELPLCQTPLDLNAVFPQGEAEPEPVPEAVPEPKKRGRKPKLAVVPEPVEDVEPPPEVVTEEDEAEAEGAVDKDEPEPETTGISEAQLRETVREIMDERGIPAALKLLAKGGYKHVKDIPPADYDRIHAILKEGVSHAQ
jgi:hypothetical protein